MDAFSRVYRRVRFIKSFRTVTWNPAVLPHNNGTNFVGAHNELAEKIKRLKQQDIISHLSRREMKWHFNPPVAPHFGGVWERLVRTEKLALICVLHGQTLTEEMLTTALLHVENLFNSRPLTTVGLDPRSREPLTPHHLLLGRANPNLPPDVFSEREISSSKK